MKKMYKRWHKTMYQVWLYICNKNSVYSISPKKEKQEKEVTSGN